MKKSKIREAIMINPRTSVDIADIRRTLQEREVSVLVNMSKEKADCKLVNASIDYILSGTRSYMTINVKKFSPKVFICYSKRRNML